MGRNVIIVGDINISPEKRDTVNAKKEENFDSRLDRVWLRGLLQGGAYRDVFRQFHPDRQAAYTAWSVKTNSRENNHGSRIDLFITADAEGAVSAAAGGASSSGALAQGPRPLQWTGCDLMPEVMGSDHCPVYAGQE